MSTLSVAGSSIVSGIKAVVSKAGQIACYLAKTAILIVARFAHADKWLAEKMKGGFLDWMEEQCAESYQNSMSQLGKNFGTISFAQPIQKEAAEEKEQLLSERTLNAYPSNSGNLKDELDETLGTIRTHGSAPIPTSNRGHVQKLEEQRKTSSQPANQI